MMGETKQQARTSKPAPAKTAAKAPSKPASAPAPSNLGLGGMDLAALLDGPVAKSDGKPLEIPLDHIEPDPNQPRRAFDRAELEELAASIEATGVSTPISVRAHPTKGDGYYIINMGERRWRASNIAGKATVPAFVDETRTKVDQVIENLQRAPLTPVEIAAFIKEEVDKGTKKGVIAKSLGKSNAFITQYLSLLKLPAPIDTLFKSGTISDVTVLNELARAFADDEEATLNFLAAPDVEIGRDSVKNLRDFIGSTKGQDEEQGHEKDETSDRGSESGAGDTGSRKEDDEAPKGNQQKPETPTGAGKQETPATGSDAPEGGKAGTSGKEPDPDLFKKAIVQVQHDGRPGRLMLNRRPPADGWAWVKYDDDGHEFEADLKSLQLVALIEA